MRLRLFAPLRDKGHLVGMVTGPTRAASFDHLVGERKQVVGDPEAEPFRRPQVDHKLEPGGQYDRQIARLGAVEDAPDISPDLPVYLDDVDAVADEPAGHGIFAKLVHRRYAVSGRQGSDPAAMRIEERGARDSERPDALGCDGVKCRVDLVLAVGAQDMNRYADC